MASFFYQNSSTLQLKLPLIAKHGDFRPGFGRFGKHCVFRPSDSAYACGTSLKLGPGLGITYGGLSFRNERMAVRICVGPQRSRASVARGAAVTKSANLLTRVLGLNLLADFITTYQGEFGQREDPGPPPSYLKSWLRSISFIVMAIVACIPQPLGAEPLAYSDCKDLSAYYAPLKGLEGQNLKARLHDIIKDHQVFPYIQVWDALKVLDEAGDDPNSVIDIYSLKKMPKSLQARREGWNREHLWPRSYGLVLGRAAFTDLHNLRPSDVNVNSSRGNKYFGECGTILTNACLVPANKEAASDTGTNKDIWMPPAQVRGDIARALLYMAVRYGSEQPTGSQELQLSDSPSLGHAQMGILSDLLHWNEIDPPSEDEQLRNTRVCSLFQHNRNPFIDHPEYAKSIWGPTYAPSTDEDHSAGEPLQERTVAMD